MQDKNKIKKIMQVTESVRRLQMVRFQRWAEKKCNEYIEDSIIKSTEKKLERDFCKLFGFTTVPYFVELYGDPRGFVVKILTSELDAEASRFVRHESGLAMDFGGDYAIVSDEYLPQ